MAINSDKPHLWHNDILQSVDMYNTWYSNYAPRVFSETRVMTIEEVNNAFTITNTDDDYEVEFSYGGTHLSPEIKKHVSKSTLLNEYKWTRFPTKEDRSYACDNAILSDYFHIKRGIATGGNEFFILSLDKILQLGLRMEYFRPILASPRYLDQDVIYSDREHFGSVRKDNRILAV